ncbi:Bcr/CflA family multidrug efflux MFS transporter [Chondromyces apiculatus]|uniref:Multidrug resistance transporter, Bcr/CflA family n=1 Tax=Chondromyces apiculatus DSM 436 TaxID=1192034 RepID=A0A017T5Y0_9BACT|nr:Bcr/CflA family multidrug efflux MFS transporter [Chondromyces apiculatus]EYF04663.1 Multidrug resistance transporter, Bcr/CflA family [Chondromyces apiculatus DSM 436]
MTSRTSTLTSPSGSAVPLGAPTELRLALILGALSAIGPLTIDMYLPSFPDLATALGVSIASVQLTLAAYLAGLAVGQIAYGPLADRFGRRAPLLAGLTLYVAASLACSMATTLPVLATARFIQALGGCAGIVISRTVVRDHFDERGSARLYSSLMLVMGIAPILAPLIGSQLLLVASWRAIFLVLALVGVAALLMIALALPESLPPEARRRRSLSDVFRTFGGLLRERRFVRLSIAGGTAQAAMFAYISGSPFVFIELFHISPQRYPLIFGANAFGLIAASQINRWLVGRHGVIRVFRVAIVIALAAYAALWLSIQFDVGLIGVIPSLFVGIASGGLILPNATAAAMAPYGAQAGSAAALLGTLQMACGATAAATVSALADGTARPMVTVMLGCAVLALLLAAPERPAPRPA